MISMCKVNPSVLSDASIDFLQHYRLVDATKIDIYAKPFIVEDDNMEGIIPARVSSKVLLIDFFAHTVEVSICFQNYLACVNNSNLF